MILTFQRKYTFALGGISVITFYPGNQWEVDENGPDAHVVKAVLGRGDAIETKPMAEIETKREAFQKNTFKAKR